MCRYCEKGKKIEEVENDNIYFEIYGKHLRVIGKVLNIPIGRDIIIEYCPMCRKEAGRVKLENFKKTKTFIDTRNIRAGDLLRIIKDDGKVFEGIVLFNTGFKYYDKTNEQFKDIMLNETDASDIESIEILNR